MTVCTRDTVLRPGNQSTQPDGSVSPANHCKVESPGTCVVPYDFQSLTVSLGKCRPK